MVDCGLEEERKKEGKRSDEKTTTFSFWTWCESIRLIWSAVCVCHFAHLTMHQSLSPKQMGQGHDETLKESANMQEGVNADNALFFCLFCRFVFLFRIMHLPTPTTFWAVGIRNRLDPAPSR